MGYGRKSYDVVGYTYNAEMYCVDCMTPATITLCERSGVMDPPNPIFADQVGAHDDCAVCGGVL